MRQLGVSRRLFAGATALVLATVIGPLALPAVAEAGGGSPQAAATTPLPLPVGSTVVSAGTTGFLSKSYEGDLLWTRYADGATTAFGHETGNGLLHGSVSDTVVTEHYGAYGQDHYAELHDMATGTVDTVPLGTTRSLLGASGGTLVTCRLYPLDPGTCHELHLIDVVAGEPVDRTVTSVPADTTAIGVMAAVPGEVMLSYRTAADTQDHLGVLDLASGAFTAAKAAKSGVVALSASRFGVIPYTEPSVLTLEDRATGAVTRIPTGQTPYDRSLLGLTGDWAVFGIVNAVDVGSAEADKTLKAVPFAGGAPRKLLDHATSVVPAPDGSLLAAGGTLAQGEGVYRVSQGPDGVPVVAMVAGTGQPTVLALTSSSVPPVATLSPAHWKARWQLSRGNAEVVLTLRNTATGAVDTSYLYPRDTPTEPTWMDTHGLITFDWDGRLGTRVGPNGAYTWQLTATPFNGIGPVLKASGAFTVARTPAPHDFTDNGSPDLLGLDSSGVLWREDTFPAGKSGMVVPDARVRIGPGWNTYDRIAAVGNIAGSSAGDLVARDRSGVLWLYTGTGKGQFAARTRIGGGWGIYTQLTGMSDVNGDGRADLVARDASGVLWLYTGTGRAAAPFAARTRIGGGWNVYTQLVGVGDGNVDGRPDLVAEDRDGTAWVYLGTGDARAPFAARRMSGVLFSPRYKAVV